MCFFVFLSLLLMHLSLPPASSLKNSVEAFRGTEQPSKENGKAQNRGVLPPEAAELQPLSSEATSTSKARSK